MANEYEIHVAQGDRNYKLPGKNQLLHTASKKQKKKKNKQKKKQKKNTKRNVAEYCYYLPG